MKWESGSEWRQVRKNKWNSSLNEFGFGDGGSWKLIFHEKYMRVIENDGRIWKDKGKYDRKFGFLRIIQKVKSISFF